MSCQTQGSGSRMGCPTDIQNRAKLLLDQLGACECPATRTIPDIPVAPIPNGFGCPLPTPRQEPTPNPEPPKAKPLPNNVDLPTTGGGKGPLVTQNPEGQGGGKGPVVSNLPPQTPREIPNPNNPDSLMADFIYPQDKFLAYLACIVYGPRPHVINGAYIDQDLTTDRIAVWKTTSVAYIACKGTGLGTSTGAADFFDDIALTMGILCNLSIVKEGNAAVAKLQEMGYFQIHICGHSLGGRGALCVASSNSSIKKCVVLNAGAPVVAPGAVGPGPNIATHYHIYGDLISTHQRDSNCLNVRVLVGPEERYKLLEVYRDFLLAEQVFAIENGYDPKIPKELDPPIKIDWFNPVWHGTERFYKSPDPWRYATPQEEQLSLEAYFLVQKNIDLTIISTALSSFGLEFVDVLKDAVCGNPIDGAINGPHCQARDTIFTKILNLFWNAVGIAIGAVVGFLAAGPAGVIAGAGVGLGVTKGNLSETLNLAIPGWKAFTMGLRNLIINMIKFFQKTQGELSDAAEELIGVFMDDAKSNLDPALLLTPGFGNGIDQMSSQLGTSLDQMIKADPAIAGVFGLY